METLYAVDGMLTEKAKAFERHAKRCRFDAALYVLCMVFILSSTVFGLAQTTEVSILAPHVLIVIFAVYLGSIGWWPRFLKVLHIRMDPKGAKALRKRYSDGYQAWAFIIVGLACLVSAWLFWSSLLGAPLLTFGEISFPLAYFHFLARQEDRGGKKRKLRVTNPLSKLFGQLNTNLVPAN